MANWTPAGFIGQMFKVTGRHVPPPPMPSPLLWGDEETARARLREGFSNLQFNRRNLDMALPMSPAEAVEFFRTWYGPTGRAFAALDDEAQADLQRDLEQLWSDHNRATDGTTLIASEYLEVQAIRA